MKNIQAKLFSITTVSRVQIRLIVVNASSQAVAAGGKWAVKDEDTETVEEATFGRIIPGGSEERDVYLPTGVEWGIFRFQGEDHGGWTAPHGGNNTQAYKLTLTD
ncbi:MAG: hypothetical protein KDE09_10520 [Anaerolineales bacterium]|nr:hypothetical protein [Anaerolineales bacterium]